jgi:hypothetical protein
MTTDNSKINEVAEALKVLNKVDRQNGYINRIVIHDSGNLVLEFKREDTSNPHWIYYGLFETLTDFENHVNEYIKNCKI